MTTTANRFGIQAVSFNGTEFTGATGESIDRGRNVVSQQSDGAVFETTQFVEQIEAKCDFNTWALSTILAALGTSGVSQIPFVTLDGTDGLVMQGALAAANAPAFAGGSVHMARTALNGALWLSSVRWSLKQKAEMNIKGMFVGTGDGTTDPVTPSTVALPTQLVPNNGWTLSSLILNGVNVITCNSVELSINPKFEYEYSLGLPVPISLSGAGPRGPIEIRLVADVGDVLIADGVGTVSLVFTQYAIGGGLAAHTVTFTLRGNYSFENSVGAQASSPYSKRMTVIPTLVSTNFPLIWAIT
jgi:hypothetical protein